MEWEKRFANHLSDKRLTSGICKELFFSGWMREVENGRRYEAVMKIQMPRTEALGVEKGLDTSVYCISLLICNST